MTKHKQAEKALRDSEAMTRAVLNAPTDDLILLIDSEGTVLDLNEAANQRIGRGLNDIRGLNLYDLLQFDIGKFRKSKVDEAIRSGKHIRFEDEYQGFMYDTVVYPILDSEGRVTKVAIFIRDITERKKMEKELLMVQKLESLGVFAGGIAHDINNILTVIMGNISLAKVYTNPGDEVYRLLAEAEKASFQVQELIQRFTTFSKGGALAKKKASISELVRESVSLTLSGSNVRCKFSFPDDLWQVEIDEEQMCQVVNALTANANEAMPEGGVITISAENVTIKAQKTVIGLPLQEGNYIKLCLQDQGVGIPQEHLPNVFDPYFSTKERGNQKGMGLGLSTAYYIIDKHSGYITVDSEVDVGTAVYVYLSAFEEENPEKKDVEAGITAGKEGRHFPLNPGVLFSRNDISPSL